MRFWLRAALVAAFALAPLALASADEAVLGVARGGCGATTAAGCRANLGAAAAGPNGDITGLGGLAAPLATTPGSIMGTGFTPPGVPAGYVETMAQVATQSGVLVDTLRSVVDADDTMSFERGCTAGLALLGGPHAYLVHDFQALNSACSAFIFRGVPGLTIIRRDGGTTANFIDIRSASVYLDGVIIDGNSSSQSANQNNIMFDGAYASGIAQTIVVAHSKIYGSTGANGNCLAIYATGPALGGSFLLDDDDISACAESPVYLSSSPGGVIRGGTIHDSTTSAAVYITVTGGISTVSATNYSSHIYIDGTKFARVFEGVEAYGYAYPYSLATIPNEYIYVYNCDFVDNYNYSIALYGYWLSAYNDTISQSSPSVSVFGGINALGEHIDIKSVNVNLQNTPWGIDVGGSVDVRLISNKCTMNEGTCLNVGGTQDTDIIGNNLNVTGSAVAISAYANEQSGSSHGFPTNASNIRMHGDEIKVDGTSAYGIKLLDDPGGAPGALPIIVGDEDFKLTNGATYSNAIVWRGGTGHVFIGPNTVNGSSWVGISPNSSGDVLFDYVNFGQTILEANSAASVIRSFATKDLSAYAGGGSILYVDVVSGGAGYTAATVMTTSDGCTWTGSPVIDGGVIVGVRTINVGSGTCVGATVSASDSGGGSGATFSVGNLPGFPAFGKITYLSKSTKIIETSGGASTISPAVPMQMGNYSTVQLIADQNGHVWHPLAYQPPSFPSTGLPTCNAAAKGAMISVSDTVRPAGCNGVNWIYGDGTVVP